MPVREQTAYKTAPPQLGREVLPVLNYTYTIHYKARIHMPRNHFLHQPNQGEPLYSSIFSIGYFLLNFWFFFLLFTLNQKISGTVLKQIVILFLQRPINYRVFYLTVTFQICLRQNYFIKSGTLGFTPRVFREIL